jgi:hypothetical protein
MIEKAAELYDMESIPALSMFSGDFFDMDQKIS